MRIFKNKRFAKFAKDEGISNEKLIAAVKDAEAGLMSITVAELSSKELHALTKVNQAATEQ
ncbi:MAG: type II toxin-antitoxin system RelE/ParE family toxin [Sulfuricellaceae bacterium]